MAKKETKDPMAYTVDAVEEVQEIIEVDDEMDSQPEFSREEVQQVKEEWEAEQKAKKAQAPIDFMEGLKAALVELNEAKEEAEKAQAAGGFKLYPLSPGGGSKFKVRFVPDENGQFFGFYQRYTGFKNEPKKLKKLLGLRVYVIAVSDDTPAKYRERLDIAIGNVVYIEMASGRGSDSLMKFLNKLEEVKLEFQTDTDILTMNNGVTIVMEKLTDPAGAWEFKENRREPFDLSTLDEGVMPTETVAEFCQRQTEYALKLKASEGGSGSSVTSLSDLDSIDEDEDF